MLRIVIALALLPALAFAQFAARRGTVASGGGAADPILPNSFGCFGDSIMAGACNAISPCARTGMGVPGSTYSQWAVSGYTAAQINDQYFDHYATGCNGEECGYILVNGGVNSLKAPEAVTGVVEAQALAEMTAIVDQALGRGRRVVWIGVLPYASCDIATCPVLVDPGTRARTYNSLMATACAVRAGPLLSCIIPYEQFESDEIPDALRDDYACSDGIHLQDTAGKTGPQALTALILDVLGY